MMNGYPEYLLSFSHFNVEKSNHCDRSISAKIQKTWKQNQMSSFLGVEQKLSKIWKNLETNQYGGGGTPPQYWVVSKFF